MSEPSEMTAAKRHAGQVARETGGESAIVIVAKGDALIVGAWCPTADVIKILLRQALEQMEAGEAIHVPHGLPGGGPS